MSEIVSIVVVVDVAVVVVSAVVQCSGDSAPSLCAKESSTTMAFKICSGIISISIIVITVATATANVVTLTVFAGAVTTTTITAFAKCEALFQHGR